MKNAINDQFSMTPGSKEVDTQGTFKMDAAVLNMGAPANYGTPLPMHEPGHEETRKEKGKRVYEEAMAKLKAQQASAAAKKKMPKKKSLLPRITSGMGSSFTTHNE